MCEAGHQCERLRRGDGMEQIAEVLHDLCQPLTTLRGRMELAELIGTAEAYREAVELGLVACVRLVEAVELMRELVATAKQD
jgi:signal transduction histidine kinase